MTKLLLADDEPQLVAGLARSFRREGFEIVAVSNGHDIIDAVLREQPQLILLDVMLPGLSGLDACRELRRRGMDLPIIMLTARGEEIDRVLGLELGADDYVTKPFGLRELVARVRARLRRVPPSASGRVQRYRIGEVDVDFAAYQATRAGAPLELTMKECDLLQLLVQHRGTVVSRSRILNEIWGYDATAVTRTVDTHVVRLRQKIEPDPSRPQHILSVYGEGYRFVD